MKVRDKDKTKEQLTDELAQLRQRVTELEVSETGRKQDEEALGLERDKLQALSDGLAGTQIGVDIVGSDYRVQFQNQILRQRFGDLTGKLCYENYMGLEKPCDFCPMTKAIETNKVESVELRAADGRDYELLSAAIPNPDGTVDKAIEVILDITERKQGEEALRRSEERYRTILDEMQDCYWEAELAGNLTFVNDATCRTLGYSREELTGMNYRGYIAEEDAEATYQALNNVYRTGQPAAGLYWKMVRKDGSVAFAQASAFPIRDQAGEIIGFRGIAHDVTERKQAEQALKESEERYRTILEEMEEGYYELDLAGNFTFFNDSMCRMLGYSREELMGMNYRTDTPPEDVKTVFEHCNRVYRTGEPLAGFTCRTIRKDGSTAFAEVSVLPLRNEEGEVVGFRGIRRDITERKQAEEVLRRPEERYRLLAENMTDAIVAMDMDLRLTYVSPSVRYFRGYSAEEVMSMSLEELLSPSSRELASKTFAEELAMENAEPLDLSRPLRTLEVEVMRPDGSTVPIEIKMVFTRGQDGRPTGILGVIRDITERKQMEAKRRELEQKAQLASRLTSVGEMASGIAHEINNPLTGVIGYSQLLLRKDIPRDIKDDVKAIHDGAQRVAAIVKRLLTFARQQKPQRDYVSVNELIETTLALRTYELETNNIKVTTYLAPELPATIADGAQLQQVFLNLIVNAETEMKLAHGMGKLSIKTEAMDNSIRICFADDGLGIAQDNLERIFDPFFTTREVGQGTGLGLSVCHGIIAEHNGQIYVGSKPGKGATFIVELPIVTRPQQLGLAEPEVEESQQAPKAKILVVDDELVIRDFLSRVLTDEGHEVETVDNADDALEMAKSNGYSLILLDIKMPGRSGIELYNHFRKTAASLVDRVVFITGDVMGSDTTAFLSRTKAPRIDKPFDAEQLKKEINRMLGEGIS